MEKKYKNNSYIDSFFKAFEITDFKVKEFIIDFTEDLNEIQNILMMLNGYSKLMHVDLDVECTIKLLHKNIVEKFIYGFRNDLLYLSNISYSYLFINEDDEHNNMFNTFHIIPNSVKYVNNNLIIFDIKDTHNTELFKVKLKRKKGFYYTSSNYFPKAKKSYKLDVCISDSRIILYRKFDSAELYINIDFW